MSKTIDASVSGQLLKRLVAVGEVVVADTDVALIEAMKMHIPVAAEVAGTVARWLVDEGSVVTEGQALLVLA